MVVGNGLLAASFKKNIGKYANYIIFASGVSNSKEIDNNVFLREKLMLIKTLSENKKKKLIYFSSILTDTIDNPYYNHKKDIEEYIKLNVDNYIIFRVPQIVGEIGNQNNLFTYLKRAILNHEKITIVKNVKRAIVDVDDLVKIVDYCKDKINLSILKLSHIEKINVLNLVNMLSNLLKEETTIEIVENENNKNWESINDYLINEAINYLKINKNGYIEKTIKKYLNK